MHYDRNDLCSGADPRQCDKILLSTSVLYVRLGDCFRGTCKAGCPGDRKDGGMETNGTDHASENCCYGGYHSDQCDNNAAHDAAGKRCYK